MLVVKKIDYTISDCYNVLSILGAEFHLYFFFWWFHNALKIYDGALWVLKLSICRYVSISKIFDQLFIIINLIATKKDRTTLGRTSLLAYTRTTQQTLIRLLNLSNFDSECGSKAIIEQDSKRRCESGGHCLLISLNTLIMPPKKMNSATITSSVSAKRTGFYGACVQRQEVLLTSQYAIIT